MYNRCLLTIFILYNCTAVFVIVAGQTKTGDNEDNSLYTVVDQLNQTVATLQAELAELKQEARPSSVTLDNSKYCFPSNCANCFKICELHFYFVLIRSVSE